jgi:hypothetical protein
MECEIAMKHKFYLEAVIACLLFAGGVVSTFFTKRYVNQTRTSIDANSSQGRFVNSPAYIPFVRFVGLWLFVGCWFFSRHCWHLVR